VCRTPRHHASHESVLLGGHASPGLTLGLPQDGCWGTWSRWPVRSQLVKPRLRRPAAAVPREPGPHGQGAHALVPRSAPTTGRRGHGR